MPLVHDKEVLKKIYAGTKKKIDAREIPTLSIEAGRVLYRSIDLLETYSKLPKPAPGGHVSKNLANLLLIPPDPAIAFKNRYSGPSGVSEISPVYGLYCALQQQAIVNESAHYSKNPGRWELAGRCVLKIRTMERLFVADLSPHNPGAIKFFRDLGKDTWDKVNDPDDCSTARGVGLAIAHSGWLRGLCYQTVRESNRSNEERGDNLVLFTLTGGIMPALYIESASYFGRTGAPEIFPVDFP
jgi:hypothetical protein